MNPLLGRPGAVAVEHGTVAAHYGDPLREQRLLAEGAGLVDRSDRDVLAIPGPDRLSWLHSLTSQHLERLADGTGTQALVLSPQGHVEHHLVLAELGGTTWADVEPGTGAALATFLQRMVFMLRVEPALVTGDWAMLTLVGPRGSDVLAAAGLPAPEAPYAVAARRILPSVLPFIGNRPPFLIVVTSKLVSVPLKLGLGLRVRFLD